MPHCDTFCILKRRTFGAQLSWNPRVQTTPSTSYESREPGRGDAFSDGVNRRDDGESIKGDGAVSRGQWVEADFLMRNRVEINVVNAFLGWQA